MTADDEPHLTPDLGERVETFRPMMGNVVAGFIISALLLVGGVSAIGFPLRAAYLAGWNLPMNVEKGWSWFAVGLMCLLGVILLLSGFGFAIYSWWLIAHRVEVHANGFRYCSGRATDDVPWSQVGHIRETILYERPPILKGPAKLLLPQVASTSYTVATRAGKEYGFNGDSIKKIKRFGRVLREQADRLSLPWETVETHA